MGSNNNDNNSTIKIVKENNKCYEHTTEDIFGICTQCNDAPVCTKCIFDKGTHNAHKISEITSEIVYPILKELQTITLPALNEFLKQNKSQLSESDNQLNQLEANHTKILNHIKSTFQQIINNIKSIESDLIKQLDNTLNENKEINSIQHSTYENNNKLIDSLNTIYNNNNNDHDQQHDNIEILKLNYRYKKILSNNNNLSLHFKQSKLNENNLNIEKINNSIKSLFTINTTLTNKENQQIHQIEKPAKEVKWASNSFKLCRESITFDKDTFLFAADGLSKLSTTKFPPTAHSLILLDGFNESLESIPKSIKTLYIFDINLQLVPGTIPNHIKDLCFCDGFNQTITKGIIPSSVRTLYIGDIAKPLNHDSIPNTVKTIYKSRSTKHHLNAIYTPYCWGEGRYEYVNL